MRQNQQRCVFLFSDRTGITVENLVRALFGQFDDVVVERIFKPFIDTPEKMQIAVNEVNETVRRDGVAPLVYSSMVDEVLRHQLKQCHAPVFDIFDQFLPALSDQLHMPSVHHVGRAHGMGDPQLYDRRVGAVNFALNFDDGARLKGLDEADLILIGVSRSGKTPTSLYLAMQFAVMAANYPLIEEDLESDKLPAVLKPYRHKLIGLTIAPDRLHRIRQERRSGSRYASLQQCRYEVGAAESMFNLQQIAYLDSTRYSIEELAVEVMQIAQIERLG